MRDGRLCTPHENVATVAIMPAARRIDGDIDDERYYRVVWLKGQRIAVCYRSIANSQFVLSTWLHM